MYDRVVQMLVSRMIGGMLELRFIARKAVLVMIKRIILFSLEVG